MVPAGARRRIHPGAYAIFFLLFALIVFASHLPLVGLPYYWDEVGQFIPAALDILHEGAWVPHSAVPNIHPPAVMAYLAAVWRLAGYHPASTRCAMLLLASMGLLAAFLLAIELLRGVRGTPAFLAVALLSVSPLFFGQALLAQLDAPTMLFSALALLFFLQDRIPLSAAVSVVLVMVRETGLLVPLVCAAWLVWERRWRDAACYAAPAAALAAWMAVLAHATGHWMGNASFVRYNLWEPLHPGRFLVTLARRLYFLLVADFHWVGTAAIVAAWRHGTVFRSRSWKIAGVMVAAHAVTFSLLGGAVLERYLLPALPVLYAAVAAGVWQLSRTAKVVCSGVMLAGLAAGNFVNPPYPYALEDNLAFTDFVELQSEVAENLSIWYPGARVDTIWPLTAELTHPEFGYVDRALAVRLLPDLTLRTVDAVDWRSVQVLVAFSRDMPLLPLWERLGARFPSATRDELRAHVPFPVSAQFERHGQWADVWVNPAWRAPRIPIERVSGSLAGSLHRR